MNATRLLPAGSPDGPEGWPHISRKTESEADLLPGETLFTDEALAEYIESMRPVYDAWRAAIVVPYTITDFFDRLAMDEWATIKTLAKTNPQIEYLWDKLLSLHEGIEGPPDGATPGRVLSAQAKELCAQIFGQERADQLFARP